MMKTVKTCTFTHVERIQLESLLLYKSLHCYTMTRSCNPRPRTDKHHSPLPSQLLRGPRPSISARLGTSLLSTK
jgi:hypothetical protein